MKIFNFNVIWFLPQIIWRICPKLPKSYSLSQMVSSVPLNVMSLMFMQHALGDNNTRKIRNVLCSDCVCVQTHTCATTYMCQVRLTGMVTSATEPRKSCKVQMLQDRVTLTDPLLILQALNLLRHLKSYKRISPPVDLEYQYMLEHVITLPPAAQARLPFHLILFGTAQNFWKILCMFINYVGVLLNIQLIFFSRVVSSFPFQPQSSVKSHFQLCSWFLS